MESNWTEIVWRRWTQDVEGQIKKCLYKIIKNICGGGRGRPVRRPTAPERTRPGKYNTLWLPMMSWRTICGGGMNRPGRHARRASLNQFGNWFRLNYILSESLNDVLLIRLQFLADKWGTCWRRSCWQWCLSGITLQMQFPFSVLVLRWSQRTRKRNEPRTCERERCPNDSSSWMLANMKGLLPNGKLQCLSQKSNGGNKMSG